MLREIRQAVGTLRRSGTPWTASLVLDRLVPYDVVGRWPDRRVPVETLREQLLSVFRAWGMSSEHASVAARHMLYADVHGIDSHGCSTLLAQHRLLVAGLLDPKSVPSVVREGDSTALVDAHGCIGHVAADLAANLAIAKCERAGIGAVAVRGSTHFGAAGAYAAMAAERGLLGLVTTSTREPSVVPTFGTEAALGTNPLAFAAPAARNPPFLLDMATSTASLGKLLSAWRRGCPIPGGWALDPRGNPVTDGRAGAEHRRLTPLGATPELGSHKGYGLAAMVEILSSVLPGTRAPGRPGPVGHFVLVIDPGRFRAAGAFGADLDSLVDALHAGPPADADRPVLVPGDPERKAAEERSRSGIPLPRAVVEDLRSVAEAAGASFLLDRNA